MPLEGLGGTGKHTLSLLQTDSWEKQGFACPTESWETLARSGESKVGALGCQGDSGEALRDRYSTGFTLLEPGSLSLCGMEPGRL